MTRSADDAGPEIKPDGNDFHYKVVKFLRGRGWKVKVGPYYNDAFSEKPREIDIVAEKAFPQMSRGIYTSCVIVRLFIECKYIANQTTFWFDERNTDATKKVLQKMRIFGDPTKDASIVMNHHYFENPLVATLYKTDGKNSDGDPIYKAITQSLNATIYYRQRHSELRDEYKHRPVIEINYPMIICNSFEKFVKKDTTNDSVSPIADGFGLQVDYAYSQGESNLEELFYIDVTNLDNFASFEEKSLQKDINLAVEKISKDNVRKFQQQIWGDDSFDPHSVF